MTDRSDEERASCAAWGLLGDGMTEEDCLELLGEFAAVRADERAACVAFLRARATRLLWQHGLVRNLTIRTMGLAVDEAATALENGWTLPEVESDG